MQIETAVATGTAGVLTDARMLFLTLYVQDISESRAFYERRLGLEVIEADEESVKYDAGQVILALHRASDYGVTLSGRRDDASDVVFLVDDINRVRANLEARGVVFVRRRTYEIGLVTDFYDPNGHRLMIYQPSEKALSWPSGDTLRAVWRAAGRGDSDLIGPPAGPPVQPEAGTGPPGLNGKPLVYLFMFVPDSNQALAYFRDGLGLKDLERVHCCNPACPPEEKGVAKYHTGGVLLTTHHVHASPVVDDFGKIYSPRSVDPVHTRGIAPVFHAADIERRVAELARRGVDSTEGVVRSQIGSIAKFEAPTGHVFYLYEPSLDAMKWPIGVKIREILYGPAS